MLGKGQKWIRWRTQWGKDDFGWPCSTTGVSLITETSPYLEPN